VTLSEDWYYLVSVSTDDQTVGLTHAKSYNRDVVGGFWLTTRLNFKIRQRDPHMLPVKIAVEDWRYLVSRYADITLEVKDQTEGPTHDTSNSVMLLEDRRFLVSSSADDQTEGPTHATNKRVFLSEDWRYLVSGSLVRYGASFPSECIVVLRIALVYLCFNTKIDCYDIQSLCYQYWYICMYVYI